MRYTFTILTIALFAFPVHALTPNDPLLAEQWYLNRISAPGAWDVTTGSPDVVVAVLDTGIDLDHPDLAGNVWVNQSEIALDGIDNDNNGYIDDVNGWDFVDNDATPSPSVGQPFSEDAVAHGTAIAGVIGAIGNNSEGVAGIAWNVKLMPLRILDNFGSGTTGRATDAIRYAIDNGADIINLSFTGAEIDGTFQSVVRDAFEANVIIVAAVGNTDDGGINLDETPLYPACFEGGDKADWVIGVAATTQEDTKALFSNYGSTCTDLTAPGTGIFNTMFYDPSWESFNDLYRSGWSGTSIASPMVAGAAALLKSRFPSLTPSQILTILQLSVDPLAEQETPFAGKLGAGRLNIAQALVIAPSFVSSAPPAPAPLASGLIAPPTDEQTGVMRNTAGQRIAPSSGAIGLSPLTGNAELISSVSAGWFIRSPGFDTVYYVDGELRRRPFWNATTFFTWADSWDEIVWVTDATLPTLPLAVPLTPQPGVVLVKIQSDPNVYATEGDASAPPVLRMIVSEDVASERYGPAWADYVLDIEPTMLKRYVRGSDLASLEPVDTTLLRTRAQIEALMQGP